VLGRKLSDDKARSYLAPGDELEAVISGTFVESLLQPKSLVVLVGGLAAVGLVSRDGEGGWIVVSHWALLVVGASKVTGGPDSPFMALRRDTPLPLTGKKNNRLEINGLTLKVAKKDLDVVGLYNAEPPPIAPDWSDAPGGMAWPYARLWRPPPGLPPPPSGPA